MTISVVADEFPSPEPGEQEPYALIVVLHAKPGHADTVQELLSANVALTRAEPGNLVYELHRDRAEPLDFYFYESYASIEAFRTHLATEYIIRLLEELPAHLSRDNDMIFLSSASGAGVA